MRAATGYLMRSTTTEVTQRQCDERDKDAGMAASGCGMGMWDVGCGMGCGMWDDRWPTRQSTGMI